MSAATVEKFAKHVGKRVKLEGVGSGTLAFFGPTSEGENQCGVVLDEPKGEGDGYGFFDCPDGHCFFATMEMLTRLGKDDKPLKKKSGPPKKKFDEPVSLRKKVNRTGSGAGGKRTPRGSPATTRKGAKSAATKPKRGASKLGSGVDVATAERNPRAIVRKKTASTSSGGEEAPAAAAGGDEDRPAFNAPEDWMAKIKEQEAEKAAAAAREKEAADLKAQEARLAAAQKRQEEEDAADLLRAEAAAAKADEAKARRAAQREKDQAERDARRAEAKRVAMAEIKEAEEANARSAQELDQRTKELNEKRRAQKARIAMMMSRVKKKPETTTPMKVAAP